MMGAATPYGRPRGRCTWRLAILRAALGPAAAVAVGLGATISYSVDGEASVRATIIRKAEDRPSSHRPSPEVPDSSPVGDDTLAEDALEYFILKSGKTNCEKPIETLESCTAAGTFLSLGSIDAKDDDESGVWFDPPYCYVEAGVLKFNRKGKNSGVCTENDQCLCGTASKQQSKRQQHAVGEHIHGHTGSGEHGHSKTSSASKDEHGHSETASASKDVKKANKEEKKHEEDERGKVEEEVNAIEGNTNGAEEDEEDETSTTNEEGNATEDSTDAANATKEAFDFSDSVTDPMFGGSSPDDPDVARRRRRSVAPKDEKVSHLITSRLRAGEWCFHGATEIVWPVQARSGKEIYFHGVDYGGSVYMSDTMHMPNGSRPNGELCGSTLVTDKVTVICENSAHYVVVRPFYKRPVGTKGNFTICDVHFDGEPVHEDPIVGATHSDPVVEARRLELLRAQREAQEALKRQAGERSSALRRSQLSIWCLPACLITVATVVAATT